MLIPDYESFFKDPRRLFLKNVFTCYKWLLVAPFVFFSTALTCVACIIFGMLGFPNFASKVFGGNWGRLNTFFLGVKVEVNGFDKVDSSQSYVVVANHQSLVDIPAIYGYLDMDLKWVFKKELRAIPVFGLACEKLGHIVVDRSNTEAAINSIQAARDRIVNGTSVIFFAEGTRSMNGDLLPFKKGAFRLALDLDLPVLPISIHGTREILPSNTTDLAPGKAKLTIHDPIFINQSAPDSLSELMEQTRDVLFDALNEE